MTETTDRTILVTGASSGIGHAIATLLLKRGCRVIGLARDFSKATFDSDNFVAVSIDLSRLDELAARLETLIQDEPAIDGVILCAGSGRFGSLEEFSHTQIRALIELNLTSPIYLARTLIPGMKQRASGDIVFMGSEAARTGGKRGAVYSAAKFGLRGLAQSLRQECASSGVRVSIVNPGMVKTAFFDELDFQPGDAPDNYIL
ncbi:MAG: short-chain dehydrogenase, partial [Gammaproteobacteria bacterium]